jgi:hypothetical protein
MMTMRGLDAIPTNTVLTVDRQLYETGLPDTRSRPHFASYGDPFFDAVLEDFDGFELPECVARITEKVPDTHAEVVGFGAACISDDGRSEVRLITSWQDVQNIRLDETTQLQSEQLSVVKDKLHDIVRSEFDPTRSVHRLEQDNQRAGRSQRLLDLLCMRSLLNPLDYSDDDNFWSFVKDHLDELIKSRDELLIPKLPVDELRRIKDELLFEFRLPQVEQKTMITLPILYVKAAVDAGCRLAERMRARRTELSINMARSSIERELVKEFRQL